MTDTATTPTDLSAITLDRIASAGLLPLDHRCVFVSGSIVAGWGHANSDVDVYIVTTTPADVEPTTVVHLGIDPPGIPVVVRYETEGRWDVEYHTESQVDQVLAKARTLDHSSQQYGAGLIPDEVDFLYRLQKGCAVSGADWLEARQADLESSDIRSILTALGFNVADGAIEDAVGLLQSGDDESAVLAARKAFGRTVDGLLAAHGEISPSEKWRARKLRAAEPPELSWDEYWAAETMQGLDPEAPAAWVKRIVRLCQRIQGEVDIA